MRCCYAILWFSFFVASTATSAQTSVDAPKPYATLDRESVTYRGPSHSSDAEPSGPTAVIGIVLPLKGPQQAEANALLAAARLAIQEEQSRGQLPDGRQFELRVRDESGQWGQASMEILKLFDQDHALAILTSTNGNSAHLAQQIAVKISIPILTLSSDPTTTETNVPWLFRLGPSDTDQARAFCRRIYSDLGLKKVLLLAQTDHDGRTGAAEFEKAAKVFHATPPARVDFTDTTQNPELLREVLQKTAPDAVVFWTDAPSTQTLLPIIRATRPDVAVFLCSKAAYPFQQANGAGEIFAVETPDTTQGNVDGKFRQLYSAQTGTAAGWAASDVYQAVHMLATALRITGTNRVLLRDYLANQLKGAAPAIADHRFDPAGNSLIDFAVVPVQVPKP